MTRYFIEDAKCGYDTMVDGCSPHVTVASAIKYKEDNGKTGWLYCVHPDGIWPMIALHDEDVYEEIIRGEFPEGPDYEANSFGGLSWEPEMKMQTFMNYSIKIKIMVQQILSIMHMIYAHALKTWNQKF